MTPPARTDRRRRELVALAALLLFFIAVAVFAPQQTFTSDWRASSFSVAPHGARISYELAERLGWKVARRLVDSLVPDERVVHVVLDPAFPFRAREVHALMESVRQGAALLYAMGDPTLDDSLRVSHGPPGYEVRDDTLDTASAQCQVPAQFSERVITTFQGRNLFLLPVRDSAARSRSDTLLRVRPERAEHGAAPPLLPAAIGFSLGRGRVVVVGDVDLFRNNNVRVCAWDAAVQVVRFLEYLRPLNGVAVRTTLVFDEYHQGHGARPGTTRAILRYLRTTSSGKALAHLGIAGVVLLLALGPRSLAPRDPERIERRSPLEHVDALARAYWHVNATRTAARRLLAGVQRRSEHRWGRERHEMPDEQFLDWIAERLPHRADDIALVRRALSTAMPRKALTRVGAALRRVEHDLLTFRS